MLNHIRYVTDQEFNIHTTPTKKLLPPLYVTDQEVNIHTAPAKILPRPHYVTDQEFNIHTAPSKMLHQPLQILCCCFINNVCASYAGKGTKKRQMRLIIKQVNGCRQRNIEACISTEICQKLQE